MDIAAKRDALIAAIHREESQKIIAELTVTLGRLHGNEAEEYSVNQWWFKELLKAADQQGAPLDLKRAVIGVVPKMIASLSAQPEQAKPTALALTDACAWTLDDDESGTWASSCGELWSFIDGGPTENNVRFCQGCGKPVHLTAPHGESDKTVGDA